MTMEMHVTHTEIGAVNTNVRVYGVLLATITTVLG